MSNILPEVSAEHINIEGADVLLFSVKNGLAKIGICRLGSQRARACLFTDEEPNLIISGLDEPASDLVISEHAGAEIPPQIAETINDVYAKLCAGGTPEFSLPRLIRLLPDGLYAVSYGESYPTAGENMFFWSGYGVSRQLKHSSSEISVIGDRVYNAPYLIAMRRPEFFEPSFVKKAAKNGVRSGELFGISLHISGLYSLLLKGHYAACAAVLKNKPFYTLQIQRVSKIWKQPDENGRLVSVGLKSESYRIPFESLTKEQIKIALISRKYSAPTQYDKIKSKLDVILKTNAKKLPSQLNIMAERYPDADMTACAQGIDELTKPMLDALLAGQTTLDDKVIISENYYSSITSACSYLRYRNTEQFIEFATSVMKNPELSATYRYVAAGLAKVHNEKIKQFFSQIEQSGDAGYDKVMPIVKSYLENYDKQSSFDADKYFDSLPEPKKEVRENREIIPLTGKTKQIPKLDTEAAKLMAAHVASMAASK